MAEESLKEYSVPKLLILAVVLWVLCTLAAETAPQKKNADTKKIIKIIIQLFIQSPTS
jgi:hypothetical protein